jgi:hypothetical protein
MSLQKSVKSPSIASVSDALSGGTRARIASERSVKKIEEFVEAHNRYQK